jgi:hypothetical protein
MTDGAKCALNCAQKFSRLFAKPFNIFALFLVICSFSAIYFIAYSNYNKGIWKISPVVVAVQDLLMKNGHVNESTSAGRVANIIAVDSPKQVQLDEFEMQWLRIQKDRVDWKQILAPCANNTVLGQTLPGWGKENETSLRTSYLDYIDVRPAGQFSRFFIRTKTDDSRHKTIGGDFWKVITKQFL